MILVMDYQLVLRKKMNNKLLINIQNLEDIKDYKKIGITNFLFAIKDFSLSDNCFEINELKDIDANIYLNFNRILNTKEIENFKKIIPELVFAQGILFEDVGIYQVLKATNIPLIWHQKHFVINSKSINFWLDRVESAVLSNELTKEEIETILNNVKKPVILPVYGYNQAMYSKRALLTSFSQAKSIKPLTNANLKIDDKHGFIAKEVGSETVFYYHKPFNYLSYINELTDNKIKLYLIDSFEPAKDMIKLINGDNALTEQFLENQTIYKLD